MSMLIPQASTPIQRLFLAQRKSRQSLHHHQGTHTRKCAFRSRLGKALKMVRRVCTAATTLAWVLALLGQVERGTARHPDVDMCSEEYACKDEDCTQWDVARETGHVCDHWPIYTGGFPISPLSLPRTKEDEYYECADDNSTSYCRYWLTREDGEGEFERGCCLCYDAVTEDPYKSYCSHWECIELEWDNAGVADATDISDLCPGDLSMAETLEELHVGLNDANDKNANDFESTQCDCVDTIKDEDSSFTWCREWECQESDSGDDNVNTSGNSEEIGENSGTIEIERYICSSDIPATSANGGKTCDNWAGSVRSETEFEYAKCSCQGDSCTTWECLEYAYSYSQPNYGKALTGPLIALGIIAIFLSISWAYTIYPRRNLRLCSLLVLVPFVLGMTLFAGIEAGFPAGLIFFTPGLFVTVLPWVFPVKSLDNPHIQGVKPEHLQIGLKMATFFSQKRLAVIPDGSTTGTTTVRDGGDLDHGPVARPTDDLDLEDRRDAYDSDEEEDNLATSSVEGGYRDGYDMPDDDPHDDFEENPAFQDSILGQIPHEDVRPRTLAEAEMGSSEILQTPNLVTLYSLSQVIEGNRDTVVPWPTAQRHE